MRRIIGILVVVTILGLGGSGVTALAEQATSCASNAIVLAQSSQAFHFAGNGNATTEDMVVSDGSLIVTSYVSGGKFSITLHAMRSKQDIPVFAATGAATDQQAVPIISRANGLTYTLEIKASHPWQVLIVSAPLEQ